MHSCTVGYGKEEVFMRKGQFMAGLTIGIVIPKFAQGGLPYIPGCVENASTFNFPVCYKAIELGPVEQLVSNKPDPIILEQTIEAGKELEQQGCRAITGCCGFLGNYQPEVAAALNIPCFLSSLMQIPIIKCSLKPAQKIGIITADSRALSSGCALKNCGVDDPSDVVIASTESLHVLRDSFQGIECYSPAEFEQELVGLAKQLVGEKPDIGAILLECTVLPPYAWAIQEAVRLPVFDFTTMINWAYDAVVRRPFVGFI